MTDYPVIASAKTALLAAMGYLDSGDIDGARHFCRQVLAADPKHPQAAILAVWIAAQARDEAGFRQALQEMTEASGIWGTVPRLPSLQGPPVFLDSRLETLFGHVPAPVSDISDHLGEPYFMAVSARPRLIVELGTRGGESTRALMAAAWQAGARMLSVDIDPCEVPDLPDAVRRLWTFIRHDDVAFAQGPFAAWCAAEALAPEIDVLFIDTSHLYDHTKAEIAAWAPKVGPRGVMIFHDTHMDAAFMRIDGSIGGGWDNDRGVIRAIEELLGLRLDETRHLAGTANGWAFRHAPKSNGFTILQRLPEE